tara:strand:- start:464 stop:613 length:150 start_codon:yes stop_codon:yes gene_type:complete
LAQWTVERAGQLARLFERNTANATDKRHMKQKKSTGDANADSVCVPVVP